MSIMQDRLTEIAEIENTLAEVLEITKRLIKKLLIG